MSEYSEAKETASGATSATLPDAGVALGVFPQGGDLAEAALEAGEQAAMEAPLGWAERVIAPQTLLADRHQARAA